MFHLLKKIILLVVLSFMINVSCAYAQNGQIEKINKKIKVLENQLAGFKSDYDKLIKKKAPRGKIDAMTAKMEDVQGRINLLSRDLSKLEDEERPALTQEEQRKRAETGVQIQELGRQVRELGRALYLLEEKMDQLTRNGAPEGELKQLDSEANMLRQDILQLERLQVELDKSTPR